jgi:hypothetical protein
MTYAAAKKLCDYLDREDSDIFSAEGNELQILYLRELESKALVALTSTFKEEFRKDLEEAVYVDVGMQALNLIRCVNCQATLINILKAGLLTDETLERFKATIVHNNKDIIDKDEELSTLMRTIIHIMKQKKEETQ